MNGIETLLSGDRLANEDVLRATANSLRNKQDAANLLSMTTIAPLARAARSRGNQVQQMAARGGMARNQELQRQQQSALAKARQEEIRKANELAYQRRVQLQEMKDNAAMDRKLIKATQAVNGTRQPANMSKISGSEYDKARSRGAKYADAMTLYDGIGEGDKSYDTLTTGNLGVVQQKADELLASTFPSAMSKTQQKRQDFWRQYKLLDEAVVRHELFGSALTAPEIKEWKSMKVSPNDPPDILKKNFERQQQFIVRKAKQDVAAMKARGYTDSQIRAIYPTMMESESADEAVAGGTKSDNVQPEMQEPQPAANESDVDFPEANAALESIGISRGDFDLYSDEEKRQLVDGIPELAPLL